MRRVGHCGRRPRALVWTRGKITDRRLPQRVPAEELAEDEAFFSENDFDPTAAFIQSLERDRALLEEKERIGQQTPEWQEYEREVEAAIAALEAEWLTRPEPITKETVKLAKKAMEDKVIQVQTKHQKLNLKRIAAYEAHRRAIAAGKADEKDDESLPVSKEMAALLDRFQ